MFHVTTHDETLDCLLYLLIPAAKIQCTSPQIGWSFTIHLPQARQIYWVDFTDYLFQQSVFKRITKFRNSEFDLSRFV